MKWMSMLILGVLLAVGTVGGERSDVISETKTPGGGEAPKFSLPGTDGAIHSLEDHLGKRAVVIAWYPKAFTGG